jgi:hypothetical protein
MSRFSDVKAWRCWRHGFGREVEPTGNQGEGVNPFEWALSVRESSDR